MRRCVLCGEAFQLENPPPKKILREGLVRLLQVLKPVRTEFLYNELG